MPVWVPIVAAGLAAVVAATAGYLVARARRAHAPRNLAEALAEMKQSTACQQTLLDALLSTTPDLFHVHDQNGRFLYASPATLTVLGLPAQDVIGKTWAALGCTAESTAAFNARLSQVFETGKIIRTEDRLPLCDPQRSFEQILSPLRDESARVVAVVSTLRDITKRRRAEHQLRDNEEKYRRLYEIESDAISLIDNETGRILEVNPAFERLYGYRRDELLTMRNTDLSAEPDQTRSAVQDGMTRIPVRHHRKRDGSVFPVEIMAGYLTWQGRPCHVAAMRDMTEWVETQEMLRQRTGDLEAQNAELDAFAHTVAHDLQNPIGVIMGYAAFLRDNLITSSMDQLQAGLHSIDVSAQKMSRIIRELLLLSMLRTEDVKAEPMEMLVIVAGAQLQVSALMEEYGAQIRVPDEWPMALGYSPWIEEVWANYLSNAIKYGGQPPRVDLGAELEPDGMIRFWVRDNGIGIAPEDQGRLFTPYTRVNTVHTKGHGLGLSIVRRIITRLDGEVGVISAIGAGSEFYFRLPAASVNDTQQKDKASYA